MQRPLLRLSFDAPTLLREHPPRLRHPNKALLFDLAYPNGIASPASIDVTRWAQHVDGQFTLPASLHADVRPDFYDYQPVGDAGSCVEWHVNFADPRLFMAYGSGLFAQDEMQVAEHPLLASVREAMLAQGLPANTSDETGATPVLVTNVERRIEVSTAPDARLGRPAGLYGNHFAAAPPEVVRQATRQLEPPTFTNLIAIAAPAGGQGDYADHEIAGIFATAVTAFAAARQESVRLRGERCRTIVHTGFWGCGAFGGNRTLMIALQLVAARAAGVDRVVLHAGDAAGMVDARRGLEVADDLAARCGPRARRDEVVARTAMLGLRWGVSDGN